jgi:hypothetical protein
VELFLVLEAFFDFGDFLGVDITCLAAGDCDFFGDFTTFLDAAGLAPTFIFKGDR